MSIAAQHLPLDAGGVGDVFPHSLERFFRDNFNRKMLRLNHTDTHLDVREMLWDKERDFPRIIEQMEADGKFAKGSGIKEYPASGVAPASREEWRHNSHGARITPHAKETMAYMRDAYLANGTSFMLRFEAVSPAHRPYKWLSDGLFNVTGIPASIHLYCSAPGARVLKPHTDPYDVLVWQLEGVKQWRACTPRSEIGATLYAAGAELSDAQRCLLQELAKDSISGCTSYTVDDTHSLECEDFTMAPGDVLYMPKGVVHYALTEPGAESYHLTIGLHRENMQWRDAFYHLLAYDAAGGHTPLREGAEGWEAVRAPIDLMQVYSETAEGVHLHEFVQGWLLLCRRPWYLNDKVALSKLEAELTETGQPSCAVRDAELRRLYDLHLERFGNWVYQRGREGWWKSGLDLAERERKAGQEASMESVSHIVWWPSDFGFFRLLAPTAERFGATLDWLATIVDHDDTVASRWKKRVKGGALMTQGSRAYGEVLSHGATTLCDELGAWSNECSGSDHDHCEVLVGEAYSKSAFTCEAYCEEQGAWCESAFDDTRGGCQRSAQGGSQCSVARSKQICRCRRSCKDEGPWLCEEEGCPARSVTCGMLGVACRASFSDIWRKPPSGMGQMKVSQACPFACKACECKRDEYKPQAPPPFATAKNVSGTLDLFAM